MAVVLFLTRNTVIDKTISKCRAQIFGILTHIQVVFQNALT
jgi:hypothetical protein